MTGPVPERVPRVSVVMANYCGAPYLDAAIRSVLGQSMKDVELILSDDASHDDSLSIMRAAAARDHRVRVMEAAANGGPAVARNRAIGVARGEWLAIVDSDDLIHPQRLFRLVEAAERLDADLIADDLVSFGPGRTETGQTLLQSLSLAAPRRLMLQDCLAGASGAADTPGYGYLKPVIRRRVLGELRYDEALTIGEDYDLLLRLILGGARCWITPDPTYLYRRHGASVSQRLSVPAVRAMLEALRRLPPMPDAEAERIRSQVERSLMRQLRFERLVEAIKARRPGAVASIMRRPWMVPWLARSLRDRIRRRRAASQGPDTAPPAPAGRMLAPAVPPPGLGWGQSPVPVVRRLVLHGADGVSFPDSVSREWGLWLAAAVSPAGGRQRQDAS